MAEGQRHAGAEVSVGELLVVRYIRTADTCGLDGDLHFAYGRVLNRPSFLDSVVLVDVVSRLRPHAAQNNKRGDRLCNRQILGVLRGDVPIAGREVHARQTQ